MKNKLSSSRLAGHRSGIHKLQDKVLFLLCFTQYVIMAALQWYTDFVCKCD